MKKTIVGLFLVMIAAAGTAFAQDAQLIDAAGTSLGTQAYRPSNNVSVFVASMPGTSLNIGGYSVGTVHANGNREFASNSQESKIYWRDKVSGTALGTSSVTVTAGTPPTFLPVFTSGWNSL